MWKIWSGLVSSGAVPSVSSAGWGCSSWASACSGGFRCKRRTRRNSDRWIASLPGSPQREPTEAFAAFVLPIPGWEAASASPARADLGRDVRAAASRPNQNTPDTRPCALPGTQRGGRVRTWKPALDGDLVMASAPPSERRRSLKTAVSFASGARGARTQGRGDRQHVQHRFERCSPGVFIKTAAS
jgi:hypothetical protein